MVQQWRIIYPATLQHIYSFLCSPMIIDERGWQKGSRQIVEWRTYTGKEGPVRIQYNVWFPFMYSQK
jgi:hypothetical protein